MLLYNKRGELTTTQIVTLVILILSFGIILFLIFQLNLGETTKKEVCKDSVVLKAKSLLPTGATSLNCQTEYICLSKTNDCDAKIDNPDRVVKVTGENGLYRAIADEMADCWWMFGEGRVNYVGSEKFPDFYCSLCSQIYFDSSIKEIFGGADSFSQKGVYDFIVNNNLSEGGLGYDEYMYEGIDFKSSQQILEGINTGGKSAGFLPVDLSKSHLIMMGTYSDVGAISWALAIGVGAVVGAVVVFTAPFSLPALIAAASINTLLVAGGAAAVGAGLGVGTSYAVDFFYTGNFITGKSGLNYLRPIFIEKDSKGFSKFGCEHIVTRS